MKQYYGNYLGIVINGGEKDPEGRGRCQVLIPHIMPSLYEGWNKEGEDINFEIIGDGLPTALNPDIVERLTKILPWAECAAPIVGSSPSVKNGSEETRNVALRAGSFGPPPGAFTNSFGGGSDAEAVRNAFAARYGGDITSGYCGKDARDVLINLFDYPSDRESNPGANGKDWAKKLEGLGWTKVSNNPADVTPLSMGVWGSGPYGHVATGVRLSDGRTGWVGGSASITTPDSDKFLRGGGSKLNADPNNFLGVWEPPPDRLNIARSKLGQPPINPSGIAGGANPVDTNTKLDPGEETGQYEGSIAGINEQEAKKALNVQTSGEVKNAAAAYAAAVNNLKQRGISETQSKVLAAGIIGNIKQETGFNPNKTHDNNTGYGLLGWASRPGDQRLNNLVKFAQERGEAQGINYTQTVNPKNIVNAGGISINTQIDFLFGEFDGADGFYNRSDSNNSRFWNDFINSSTASDAALYLSNKVVRPSARFANNEVRQQIAENAVSALGGLDTDAVYAEAIIGNQPITRNPTKHGRADGSNTNYQALGMFGYASEGTAVWVFFREGNPLFPVYFAASYGQREWANMYSYNSPGIGAGVGGKGAIPNTEKMRMNSYGGGFESAQVSEDPESGLEPEFNFQVYGKNGSNLLFTKDHTEFNSTYNHNQRVSGDFHEITEANKETRVRGDKNTYVEQDVYVTIGNWSDEAIAACDEIQGYINEAMDVMSAAGDSGSTTAGTSTQEPISIDEAKERARAQQDEFVRQRQEIDRLQAKIDKLPPSEQAQAQENLNETIRLLSNKVAAATP